MCNDTDGILGTVERFALEHGDTVLIPIAPDDLADTARRVLHRFGGLEWQCIFELRENGAFLLVKIYLPIVLWSASLDAVKEFCFRLPRVVFAGSFTPDAVLNTIYYQSALRLGDEPLTRDLYSYFLGRAVRTASLYLPDFSTLTAFMPTPDTSTPETSNLHIGTPNASTWCDVRKPRRRYQPRGQRRCESWRDWLREPQQPWPGEDPGGPFA